MDNRTFGYARVSSREQHEDRQIEALTNYGVSRDNIIVERCSTAQNGEMVVALVDDSATVKTFYKEDGHIRLQPENDAMDPIIVPDCKILGKVFGVFRLFR